MKPDGESNLLVVSHIQNLAGQISGNVGVVLLFLLLLSLNLLVRFVIVIDLGISVLANSALAFREAPAFVFSSSNAPWALRAKELGVVSLSVFRKWEFHSPRSLLYGYSWIVLMESKAAEGPERKRKDREMHEPILLVSL